MTLTDEEWEILTNLSEIWLALKDSIEKLEDLVETPGAMPPDERGRLKPRIIDLKFSEKKIEAKRDAIRRGDRVLNPPSTTTAAKVVALSKEIDKMINAGAQVFAVIGLVTELAELANDVADAGRASAGETPASADEDTPASTKSRAASARKMSLVSQRASRARRDQAEDVRAQEATSLRDLLLIRHANRDLIEAVNGNLGSALGRKKTTDPTHPDNGKPAIILFVPQKIAPKWLPADQEIPSRMLGPNGLSCCIDVVEGGKSEDYPLVYEYPDGSGGTVYWTDLQRLPALSPAQIDLRDRLRGWADRITPGAQLSVRLSSGKGWFGTLACFAVDKKTGDLGIITNKHVAHKAKTKIRYAGDYGRLLAKTTRVAEKVTDEDRFGGIVNEAKAYFLADCAFAKLDAGITDDDIDVRVPIIPSAGSTLFAKMGEPYAFDLDGMDPIGRRVIGVGRTRSFQRGTIAGFAYEYFDEQDESHYTDYLIIGDEPDQFSAPGDSGKLILTDEPTPRPIALLWGGWQEKLSNNREQQDWTYAIDINFVLDQLGVKIKRE